jgi:hypothetical protein
MWTASPLSSPSAVDLDPAPINLDNTELLLHFITTAAATLAGNENPDMVRFWTRNVPHIGLSHPFVLHFIFASAAFHLAYLAKRQTETAGTEDAQSLFPQRRSRTEYQSLAQQHLTAGLSGFLAQLSQPGLENCGALYLGAVLTSYCTFAAGPTSRDDLLVCTTANNQAEQSHMPNVAAAASPSPPLASWMPFVHGVRLMHQSFTPDVLFAGLMAPLKMGPPQTPLKQPTYARDGFPRLDWEVALDGLRCFIATASGGPDGKNNNNNHNNQQAATPIPQPLSLPSAQEPQSSSSSSSTATPPTSTTVYLNALDSLIGIYAATYGRLSSSRSSSSSTIATYDGPPENEFIFGWLYRLESAFTACVARREPHALLILAHYAVLLNSDTVRGGWYMDGWRAHIVSRVGELFLVGGAEEEEGGGRGWMRWPMEQVAEGG